MTRRRAGLAALVAALVGGTCLLGGCGTDQGDAPAPGDPTPSGSRAAGAAPGPGALEAYLGWATAQVPTEAEVAAELAERGEAVAACMAAHGFEYWPQTVVAGTYTTSEEPPRGTRAFAERYGYGVWRGPEVEPGQYTVQYDDSANASYRASLSPQAQAAYDAALLGTPTTLPDGSVRFDGVGGCVESPTLREHPRAAFARGVLDEAAAYLEALAAGEDAALAEVDAAWAACMREAGFDVASPYAAEQQVVAEATATTVWSDAVVEAGAAAELRLALADHDCRATTGWAERRRTVEHRLQQEYLDAHRADLDAAMAVFSGG